MIDCSSKPRAPVRHHVDKGVGSVVRPLCGGQSVGGCRSSRVGLPTDSGELPAMIKHARAGGNRYDKLTAIRIARRCDRDRRREMLGHLFLPRPVTYTLLPQSETSLFCGASLSGACSIPEHAHDQQAT